MPLTGSKSVNKDGTENISITAADVSGDQSVSVTGFANDVRSTVDLSIPNAPAFSQAGLSLGAASGPASASLTGVHIPNSCDVVTASTNFNIIDTDVHKLVANAYTSTVIPKQAPNYGIHGGSLDYTYKNTIGANTSISRTPMFNQTDYSAGANLHIQKTPTLSYDMGVAAARRDSNFGRGNWEPKFTFGLTKKF